MTVRLHHEDTGELPTRSPALLENGLGRPRATSFPRGRLACLLVDLHTYGLDIAASLARFDDCSALHEHVISEHRPYC
jgi:hypothetical protein